MDTFDSVHDQALAYQAPSLDSLYVSEADYWQHYYEHPHESYEWNNGRLEIRPMADKLSFLLYGWFFALLREYVREFPEADIMGLETAFSLNWGNSKKSIRKPDLAVIRHDNPVEFSLLDRSYKGICDICIEFLSDSTPNEVERDTVTKKAEYELGGVKEYFILDRLHRHSAFYHVPQPSQKEVPICYQTIDAGSEGIIRSQVLPGFAFRLEHLKTLPDFESLVDDPVYQPFVSKPFQQERQAKEQALLREEQALLREEQALAEVKRLQALLDQQKNI